MCNVITPHSGQHMTIKDTSSRNYSNRRQFLKSMGAASLVGTTALSGCTGAIGGGDSGSSDKLQIGLTRSTSGDYVFASEMGFRGLKLWKDNVNDDGGLQTPDGKKKIELKYYDDRSDKKRVVRLYKKLIEEDNVDLVFGPFGSTLTSAAASVANANDTFLLSWSAASPEIFNQGYDNIVSVNPTAPQITKGEIQGMADAGVKSLGLIHLNAEFPTSQADGIKKYAKEHGIEIVHSESFPASMNDFASTLSKIDSKNPDAFYPVAYNDTLINIVNQMKSNNVMFDWTSMTYAADPDFHEALGADAKYFFGHSIYHPEFSYDVGTGMKPDTFYDQFKSSYDGQTPSYIGGLGYGGGVMLGSFVRNADAIEMQSLKQAATDLSGKKTTLLGNYEITKKGVQTGFVYAATQNQGTKGDLYNKLEVVAPKEAKTADPTYPIPGWDER
jgi:branched-chain amino acid transport system substrate-binding protein